MQEFMDIWPIISGLIAVGALGIAFRAEITARVKSLEEKVKTLFDMINRMK